MSEKEETLPMIVRNPYITRNGEILQFTGVSVEIKEGGSPSNLKGKMVCFDQGPRVCPRCPLLTQCSYPARS